MTLVAVRLGNRCRVRSPWSQAMPPSFVQSDRSGRISSRDVRSLPSGRDRLAAEGGLARAAMDESAAYKALVVEDDPHMLRYVAQRLEADGHSVVGVEDGTSAIEVARTGDFDLVVLDVGLPGIAVSRLPSGSGSSPKFPSSC